MTNPNYDEETYTCDKCNRKDVPESECSFGDGVVWCNECCYHYPDECTQQ